MRKTMSKDLARLVKSIPKQRLDEAFKRERVQMSLLNVEKEEIREAADRFGLTISGYLLAVHGLVIERLAVERRKK